MRDFCHRNEKESYIENEDADRFESRATWAHNLIKHERKKIKPTMSVLDVFSESRTGTGRGQQRGSNEFNLPPVPHSRNSSSSQEQKKGSSEKTGKRSAPRPPSRPRPRPRPPLPQTGVAAD